MDQNKILKSEVSLEALPYEQIYRKSGILRFTDLMAPGFMGCETFEIPKNSIVHYIPELKAEIGIAPSHFLLRRHNGLIAAEHATELKGTQGNPLPVQGVMVNELERAYRAQYREIRPMRRFETVDRNEQNLIVCNYGILGRLNKYRATAWTELYRFNNLMTTVVDKINAYAELSTRKQFIMLELPKVLPSKLQLTMAETQITKALLGTFDNTRSLLILEIWRWLSATRENSALSKLTDEAVKSLNFVIQESGRFVIVSMGQLDEWRESDDGERRGHSAQQMQLNFLRLLDSTFSIRSLGGELIAERSAEDDALDDDEQAVIEAEVKGLEREEEEVFYDENGQQIQVEEEPDVKEVFSGVVDEPVKRPVGEDLDLTKGVEAKARQLWSDGLINEKEQRRYQQLGQSYLNIPNPYGEGSLADFAKIEDEEIDDLRALKVPDRESVFDKSMLESRLHNFDRDYIERLYKKDIINSVMSVQNAGIIVKNYQVEKVVDANNEYEIHKVQVQPVGGAVSSFMFRVPRLRDDGTFISGGVKYFMRNQHGDMPIHKTKPHEVALTSYASKMFIRRSTKVAQDYAEWLLRKVNLVVNDPDPKVKVEITGFGKVTEQELAVPRLLSTLGNRYTGMRIGDVTLEFSPEYWRNELGDEFDKLVTRKEAPIGYKGKHRLFVNDKDIIYSPDTDEILGTLEDLMQLPDADVQKAPVDAIDVNIMGKAIPIGLVLGYHSGIVGLLHKRNIEYRAVKTGSRLELQRDEWPLRFADQTLIFKREDKEAQYIMGSLMAFKKHIKQYSLEEFDDTATWDAVLELQGLGGRYGREVSNLEDMFIDPIMLSLLKRINEPTTFTGLLHRSIELLSSDEHLDEMDEHNLRIRGYERIPGAVYNEITKAVRKQRAMPVTARSKIDINPHAIWNKIQEDPSISIVEDSNPIQNLKEMENVTFSGTGGRSSRTMVRRTRQFHPTSMGLISEATVDNSNVAVTAYASPNAKLENLRGMVKADEVDLENTSSLVSTSMLLCPFSDRDDPRRVNFINIQQSHVVAAEGYRSMPVRTGYEQIVGQRTDELYSVRARGEGEVTKVTKQLLEITYKDGTKDAIAIGRTYGLVAGKVVPHDIITDLDVSDKVVAEDVVAWNNGFFERDPMNHRGVLWKSGIPVRVALIDGPETIEDSCQISQRLATAMMMHTSHIREIDVNFEESISDPVEVGAEVDSNTTLLYIEDEVIAAGDYFTEEVRETFDGMGRNAPKADYSGKVGRIEVFYNGDLEDMTEGLRKFVMAADKQRAKRAKLYGKGEATTGRVADLDFNTVKVKFYIDDTNDAGDGDKGVVGHQLKTVITSVFTGINRTESGEDIDVYFGYQSISDRIVNSPILVGMLNVLQRLNCESAAKAFRDAY